MLNIFTPAEFAATGWQYIYGSETLENVLYDSVLLYKMKRQQSKYVKICAK